MKERPILFSAPMVRALLAGTKTQTRRVVKGVAHFPEWGSAAGMGGGAWRYGSPAGLGMSDRGDNWAVTLDDDHIRRMCTSEAYGWGVGAGCPYGHPGDRLWVREAWTTHACFDRISPRDLESRSIHYQADGQIMTGKGRPSIHMPRWASRITLEITGVRVERLQDISQPDAIAEGAPPSHPTIDTVSRSFGYPDFSRSWYGQLWEQINGPGSWEANPWVWVVEFKRVTS